MTHQEIIDNLKPDLLGAVDDFKAEIMKIQTGRLNPSLIEDIKADCFGQELPLKQLGAISAVSQRELALELWDKSYVEGVINAIEKQGIDLGMRMDEKTIYLTAPALTEESRKNLAHLLNQKKEAAFQQIRHLRDRAWKDIQTGFQQGEIREDDKYKGKDKLDETTREHREKIEEMVENKEKEIKG